jgi:hypothetical protein
VFSLFSFRRTVRTWWTGGEGRGERGEGRGERRERDERVGRGEGRGAKVGGEWRRSMRDIKMHGETAGKRV